VLSCHLDGCGAGFGSVHRLTWHHMQSHTRKLRARRQRLHLHLALAFLHTMRKDSVQLPPSKTPSSVRVEVAAEVQAMIRTLFQVMKILLQPWWRHLRLQGSTSLPQKHKHHPRLRSPQDNKGPTREPGQDKLQVVAEAVDRGGGLGSLTGGEDKGAARVVEEGMVFLMDAAVEEVGATLQMLCLFRGTCLWHPDICLEYLQCHRG